MAGRNRMPRHPDGFRGFHDGPRPVMNRELRPLPIHPAALEEELEIRRREIRRILSDNRIVIDDNTLIQRELTAAKDEVRRLGQVIPTLSAEKEAQTRDLIERGLKLEADLRAMEPLKAEVVQLRAEIQKLNSLRQEMSSQIQGFTKDINRLQAENQQLVSMRADIDGLRKELLEARRACEFEQKANQEQVEQNQAMEKNLVFMAREIEKLRAEQLNAERRARGLGGGGYEMLNGSPEMRYPGRAFGDGYAANGWRHYDKRGPPRR